MFLKNKRTQYSGFLESSLLMIHGDFLETLDYQSANPNAKVGGHNVHESESSDDFETMNIQLQKLNIARLAFCTAVCVYEESSIQTIPPTLEFIKMKYICIKVNTICKIGLIPCSI